VIFTTFTSTYAHLVVNQAELQTLVAMVASPAAALSAVLALLAAPGCVSFLQMTPNILRARQALPMMQPGYASQPESAFMGQPMMPQMLAPSPPYTPQEFLPYTQYGAPFSFAQSSQASGPLFVRSPASSFQASPPSGLLPPPVASASLLQMQLPPQQAPQQFQSQPFQLPQPAGLQQQAPGLATMQQSSPSLLEMGSQDQAQLGRVAEGIEQVSQMARDSITRAASLEDRLKLTEEQLRQAKVLEEGLVAERNQLEANTRAELAKAQQAAQQSEQKAQEAEALARSEQAQVEADRLEMAKREDELKGWKQKEAEAEIVAQQTSSMAQGAEERRKEAEAHAAQSDQRAHDIEARALVELRRARLEVQKARLQAEQAQAEAMQSKSVAVVAEEQAAQRSGLQQAMGGPPPQAGVQLSAPLQASLLQQANTLQVMGQPTASLQAGLLQTSNMQVPTQLLTQMQASTSGLGEVVGPSFRADVPADSFENALRQVSALGAEDQPGLQGQQVAMFAHPQ